jgi:hypothetical protein
VKSLNSKSKSNICQKTDFTIAEFPHHPPEGYSYEFEEFKRGVVSIWLRCHRKFDYNLGVSTRTIWGFWSNKDRKFYSPVNSKTIGKEIAIDKTTPYTSMLLKLTPLESAFF